jgi:peptidoglycan/LPS O-acetylase OafA/YrhL
MRPDKTAVAPTTPRKLSWDTIRAGATLLVMLFHSTCLGPLWHPELGTLPVALRHPVGASTLLVVSGYFAAASVHRRDVLGWWLGRLFRLLPAFAVAVVATAYLMREFSPAGWWTPTWHDAGANVLMLWQWKPADYTFVDASYWTLPVQLSFFTGVLLVMRWARRPSVVVLAWTVPAVEAVLWPIRAHTTWEPFRMVHDGMGWYRMHLAVAGVAVYLVSVRRVGPVHGTALIGAGLGLHWVQTRETGTTLGVAMLTAAVCAAAVGPDWDRVIPAALHPGIRWFAGIGYGVYLTHQSLGYIVMGRLQLAGAGAWLQVPAMLAAGVLTGWLLTVAVERPAYIRLARLSGSRRRFWRRGRVRGG